MQKNTREFGSVLATILPMAVLLFAMVAGMLTLSASTSGEQRSSREHIQRLYLAEAGVAHAVVDITGGGSGDLGSPASPIKGKGGHYRVTATKEEDGSFFVTSTGTVGSDSRTLRAVLRATPAHAFHNAMFAGNDSGDPTYSLSFGGTGSGADIINGEVYSGADVTVTGNAEITGAIRAVGSVSGADGESGTKPQRTPDLSARRYHNNNDVDVAAEFTAGATYASSPLGGEAWQLPEENPAHVFRMNPSDRQSEYLSTEKDDYFLEDPYHPVVSGTALSKSASTAITFSGMDGTPGPIGNRKVYFVEGNLWVHNREIYSFMITGGGGAGTQVLFVVKGNIYFSDNILRENEAKDAFGFIALRDPVVPDSGNIYFGDPAFGTLERMDGFMYAENDFHDNNLNSSGSAVVTVNGIMSAGNQVRIHRNESGTRTRLVANLDHRLKDGEIDIPGLPTDTVEGRPVYRVLSSTEVLQPKLPEPPEEIVE